MISFTVRMRFDEADREKVEGMLRALTEGSRKEPGNVSYVAHFVDGEPATVVIYEQFADEEAVEHHRASAHFREYAVGGVYQMMRERQVEMLHAIA